jgi:hypothetical protein
VAGLAAERIGRRRDPVQRVECRPRHAAQRIGRLQRATCRIEERTPNGTQRIRDGGQVGASVRELPHVRERIGHGRYPSRGIQRKRRLVAERVGEPRGVAR